MRIIRKKGKKSNNKGMTLIELMVAVAILSVAIVPLMYAFVNSMKYNAKSRELQQTSVLAQTIMEKCKSYTTAEIDEKMDDKSFFASMTVAADGTKVPLTNGTTLWGENRLSADEVTYYVGGVQLENHKYDIAMYIQPHERYNYATGTTKTDSDMIYTESMNKYNDAVFTVNTTSVDNGSGDVYTVAGMDFEAYNAALQYINDGIKAVAATNVSIIEEVNIPLDEIASIAGNNLKVYRYIDITANNDGAGRDVVNVTYTYTFELVSGTFSYNYRTPNGSIIPLEFDVGTSEIPLFNPTFMIYDNAATSASGAVLENIYFFYYPAYNAGTEYPIKEDVITINNNTGRELGFYMVKQKNTMYTEAQLRTNEEHYYSPYITVSGNVIFYHNSDQNMGGGTLTPLHIYGSATPMGTLYSREYDNLMYDIELTIYPEGSYNGSGITAGSNPIFTMQGTMLDW